MDGKTVLFNVFLTHNTRYLYDRPVPRGQIAPGCAAHGPSGVALNQAIETSGRVGTAIDIGLFRQYAQVIELVVNSSNVTVKMLDGTAVFCQHDGCEKPAVYLFSAVTTRAGLCSTLQ